MSKIISIWGSPNSGKTTFTLKLAQAIYNTYQSKIICIFTNNTTPDLPVIFPNKQRDELFSLGTVLTKTDVTSSELQKNLVTTKDYMNMGFLGYIDGENKFTYADYPYNKAVALLEVAASLSDFVIVDCGSHLKEDSLSMAAIQKADVLLRICSPDYKSICFFSSQLPLYDNKKYRLDDNIQIMNVCDGDLFIPVQDTQHFFNGVKYTLPYVRSIRQQTLDGKLLNNMKEKAYLNVMKNIISRVV